MCNRTQREEQPFNQQNISSWFLCRQDHQQSTSTSARVSLCLLLSHQSDIILIYIWAMQNIELLLPEE